MDKAELETTPILAVRWDERGLAQAVATDARTGALLMVAYINAAALEQTIATGEAHYWSRSRQEVWHKGGTSGNRSEEHTSELQSLMRISYAGFWLKKKKDNRERMIVTEHTNLNCTKVQGNENDKLHVE